MSNQNKCESKRVYMQQKRLKESLRNSQETIRKSIFNSNKKNERLLNKHQKR